MLPEVTSLLSTDTDATLGETIEDLLQCKNGRLEHIVSRSQASAPGFWYDQAQAEWVVLLKGCASLEFESGIVQLETGDSLTIPSRLKHRVKSVSDDAVWLALHYEP